MRAEIISSYSEFLGLKTSWNTVYKADPEAQFFLSWQWLERVFFKHKTGWFIIAVRVDEVAGDYIAFFPLCMHTRLRTSKSVMVNEIRVAGRYTWSDYSGIICHPDFQEQALKLMASELKQMHWSRLYLKNLLITDQRLKYFTQQFDKSSFSQRFLKQTGRSDNVNRLICPYIELPEDFEIYLTEKLSSNSRQKIRRYLRKIENSDKLEIIHSTTDTYQRDLDILIDFWIKKWAKHKGKETKRLAKQYRDILEIGIQSNSLIMPVLWDGDKPLGALGIFADQQKKELFYFIAGRDEKCNYLPPGLVLHAHSIKWAINNGYKSYDFLRGDEQFKYSLGCTDRHIRYLVISTRTGVNLNSTLDPAYINQAIEKAREYKEKGQISKAMICFQQILDLEPENVTAHYYLGRTLYKQNLMEKAATSFDTALKLDAGDSGLAIKSQQKARYYLKKLQPGSSSNKDVI